MFWYEPCILIRLAFKTSKRTPALNFRAGVLSLDRLLFGYFKIFNTSFFGKADIIKSGVKPG